MSKHHGAKGRRQSEIEEEEDYRRFLYEERAALAGLPSYMYVPSADAFPDW